MSRGIRAVARQRSGGVQPPRSHVAVRRLDLDEALAVLWPRPGQGASAPATSAERALVDALVAAQRAAPPAEDAATSGAQALADRAARAGFVLERWRVSAGPGATGGPHAAGAPWFWVLREHDAPRRGAGTYVFRAGPAGGAGPALVVQAPHAYFERGTGALAAAIMFEADARAPAALMTNSLHRYRQASGERRRRADNPADVCHNPAPLFQHATMAMVDAGAVVVVQIHGFAATATRFGPGPAPGIVVSAGRRDSSSAVSTAVARALSGVFGAAAVRRYPEEIRVLGGTTNVQARALRRRAGAAFVHLELSPSMRRRLLADARDRAAFARALGAS